MWKSSSLSTICWRLSSPFTEWAWHFCYKLILFCSSIYSCPYRSSSLLWFLKLYMVSFEFRNCESFNFVLIVKCFCFGSSGSFVIPYEFEDGLFYFCRKGYWNFDRDCVEFLGHFGYYWHLNNIKSSYPWTPDVFPFISSEFLSVMFYNFHWTNLSPSWLIYS